jgi:hypothetical protein
MIKFSWRKINNKFGWNAYCVLEYFFLNQNLPIPPYLCRKIPYKVKKAATGKYIRGPCFLINPNEVLLNAKEPNDLYMYIELASKRNIFDYYIRGIKHLPLILVPEYLIEWVKINPMLEIKNENVYFKYEQE